jgi:three-Cys-motif partner protein
MTIDKKNIVNEPQNTWGGNWTDKKLDAFSKYVASYLKIMSKHRYWETIYFDGFAGSGDRKKVCDSKLYKNLFITEEEEKTYKGAAERVLTLPDGLRFKYYYFIDKNIESLKRLERKLINIPASKDVNIQYREGDCNLYLGELANAMKKNPKKYASLVLLDPFGMQINWDSIAQLAGTKTDIWILVPTGVIVNRLLDKNCKLKHSVKLQSFFGLSEEEIRDYFYKKQTQNTLFGEQELVQKISKPIEKISELYIKQLKTIWPHVTEHPLRLENKRGVPIFHFVFASNYQVAIKIAKDIIKNV